MTRELLFLLGGSAAFDVTADVFVPAAGGREAAIALLMQGGHNWEKYVPDYTRPWTQRGVSRCEVVVPGENGTLDLEAAAARLQAATGIFIGGGHTPTYQRLYATEPLGSIIRQCYRQGVPVAGCSAGALIAMEHCVLTTAETGEDTLQIVPGLGLVRGVLVGVHFTALETLPWVLEAMARIATGKAWGIEDSACVVFEDGRFEQVLGEAAHEIVMTNFATATHTKERVRS